MHFLLENMVMVLHALPLRKRWQSIPDTFPIIATGMTLLYFFDRRFINSGFTPGHLGAMFPDKRETLESVM
jgi:hypothetical protein